jgi:sulfatase modifying factor 1
VWIPAGTFQMGSDQAPDAFPHQVTLDGFWMAIYETTNLEFEKFKKRPRPVESRADSQPVTRIGWSEANAFCQWLSKKEGKKYRLPTEAEWEYAARGGLKGKNWPWGDAGFEGRATFGQVTTTPVGRYNSNGFGLYDMAGNVEEWVSDWYSPTYYQHSPKKNPYGPKAGVSKVIRGGSCTLLEGYVWLRAPRSLERAGNIDLPDDKNQGDGSGFRIVLADEHAKANHERPKTKR